MREQAVIDDMIIFQKPFPGAAHTELESQLGLRLIGASGKIPKGVFVAVAGS